MLSMSDGMILMRVAVAAVLGMVVGLERMGAGAPIRARTFALVAMTTTLLMAVSVETYGMESSRVVQGLVTGMGFLGAGIILHSAAGEVHGLTTAATLWAMGAIGIVIGSGHILLGILVTALLVAFIMLSDSSMIARALNWGTERKDRNAGRRDGHPLP